MPKPAAQKQVERLMELAGAETKADLARALGITSPAISIALNKGRIPAAWAERLQGRKSRPAGTAKKRQPQSNGHHRLTRSTPDNQERAVEPWTRRTELARAFRLMSTGLKQMAEGVDQLAASIGSR